MKSSLKVFPIAATLAICCAVFASTASRAADDPALQQHVQEWTALKARTGPKADITVRIASSASAKGQVLIGLYDAVMPFPTEGKHLMNAVVPVAGAQTEYTLKDIPLGDYAIAVICDENGNGKLDMRLGMIPMEPLAFSNNAKLGMFGPPKYAEARFVLPSEGITLDMACKK